MADENIRMQEVGKTGLTRFGGHIDEEWLNQLSGQRKIRVYKEMKDNDPTVGAILYAIKMLIRQVDWRIDAVSDDKADQQAAEFLEECMLNMEHTWESFISEVLTMLPFGWSYHEIVYKKRDDGRIAWKKLPIRSQDSLWEWEFDDEGNLTGMTQQPAPTYNNYTIPLDKALLFRTEAHKDNPEGRSILRTAYRPWYFKKNIEEIEGIGIERDLAGLPVAEVPPNIMDPNASDSEKALYNNIKDIVTQVRRDEMEGVVFPAEEYNSGNENIKSGFKLRLLNSGGKRNFDTSEIIGRYDKKISMTVLADFLTLGHESVGSFALADSKTDMFVLGIKAILDSVKETLNNQAVPKLFDLNSFNVDKLPQFDYGDIETPDLEALSKYIKALGGVGITINDDETENYLRDVANLPKKPKKKDNTGISQELDKLEKRLDDDIAEMEEDLKEDEKTFDSDTCDCGNSHNVKKNEKIAKEEPDEESYQEQHRIADEKVPAMSNKFTDTVIALKGTATLDDLEEAIDLENEDKIIELIDWNTMEDGLSDFQVEITDIVRQSGEDAAERLSQTLDVGIGFDVKNPKVQEWIQDHTAEMVTQVTDESKEAIRTIISEGYDKGYTNRQMAQNIKDYIGLTQRDAKAVENLKDGLREAGELTEKEIKKQANDYAKKLLDRRAMTIARNESMMAAKNGAKLSWKNAQQQGVISTETHRKEWLITPDDRLCPYCSQMTGDRRFAELNETYDTPLGPKTTTHMHIGCRCAEAIVEKE